MTGKDDVLGFCRPGLYQILLRADFGQEPPLHPTERKTESVCVRNRERERGRETGRE